MSVLLYRTVRCYSLPWSNTYIFITTIIILIVIIIIIIIKRTKEVHREFGPPSLVGERQF